MKGEYKIMKLINIIKSKLIVILILIISFCMLSIPSMATTSENTQEMTEEELTTFTKLFNKIENNGFLQSTYSKASEINLNMAFRNSGTELIENEIIEEEEYQDLLDLFEAEGFNDPFHIPVYKLTEDQVMNLYELKTGEKITSSEIKQRFSWTYSEKYNAYYTMHGDTSFNEVKCISGEKDSNGTYKIIYQAMDDKIKLYALENGKTDLTTDIDKMIVTLQEKENDYIFVSNKIYTSEKTIEDTEKQQNENKIQNNNINKDNSIAIKELPKTGENSVILVVIALVVVLGIIETVKLYKWRNIK